MQNVSTVEQTQLIQAIDALASKSMTDEVKAYNLGLLMMNVIGEDVLQQAVQVLGPLILGPPSDEPPILAQASALKWEDIVATIHVCKSLDPLARTGAGEDDIAKKIDEAVKGIQAVPVRNLLALTQLRGRFGATTV